MEPPNPLAFSRDPGAHGGGALWYAAVACPLDRTVDLRLPEGEGKRRGGPVHCDPRPTSDYLGEDWNFLYY